MSLQPLLLGAVKIVRQVSSTKQTQPPEKFYKKGVLEYFEKFTEKNLCLSLFQASNFIEK